MTLLENIIIGISLSMDAFTIAIAEGLLWKKKQLITLSISFGFFQTIMTILGYYFGKTFIIIPQSYQRIISIILLNYIGINMIMEKDNKEDNFSKSSLILFSIITSIDAFSIGITISFYSLKIYLVSIIIGIITLLFSLIGSFLGKSIKNKITINPNYIGGLILILYAIKILIKG